MTILVGTSTSTAITNYGELKTAVAAWLNKTNLTLYIPDFIRLCEQRIYWGADRPLGSVPLRIPAMQERDSGSISGSAIAFPDGFLEPVRLAVSSGSATWTLDYVSPAQFSAKSNSQDEPSFYTYVNGEIETAGSGAVTYTLDYYGQFDLLQNDADTNWLLTNAPGVYLYAALLESAPFLYDDPRVQAWHAMFKSSISALNRSANKQGGGALQVRAG